MNSSPCNFRLDKVIYKYWNIPLKLEGDSMRESSMPQKYIMFPSGELQFYLPIEKVERIVSSSELMEELEIIDFNYIVWGHSEVINIDLHRKVLRHIIILNVDRKRYGLLVDSVSAIKNIIDDERIPFNPPARNERNLYLNYVVYQQDKKPSLIYIIEPSILYEKVLGEHHVT